MRILCVLSSLLVCQTAAFAPVSPLHHSQPPQVPSLQQQHPQVLFHNRHTTLLRAEVETEESSSPETSSIPTKTLGLVTFDLDDTLYPILPVIQEANAGR